MSIHPDDYNNMLRMQMQNQMGMQNMFGLAQGVPSNNQVVPHGYIDSLKCEIEQLKREKEYHRQKHMELLVPGVDVSAVIRNKKNKLLLLLEDCPL